MLRTVFLVLALAFGTAAFAQDAQPGGAASSASQPVESQLVEHRHYTNSDGHLVHSPAHTTTGHAPAGASARCGDGTYSFSQHRRGTCSHHGGVAQWL